MRQTIKCPKCDFATTDTGHEWRNRGGPCKLLAGTKYVDNAPQFCPAMSDQMPDDVMWLPVGYRADVLAEIERVHPGEGPKK